MSLKLLIATLLAVFAIAAWLKVSPEDAEEIHAGYIFGVGLAMLCVSMLIGCKLDNLLLLSREVKYCPMSAPGYVFVTFAVIVWLKRIVAWFAAKE